jgi:3-methyladenine DNA glycosylase AlkD
VLIDDQEDLIHKATGGWLREAGKKDRRRLRTFLDGHAATMPRTMLRYAIGASRRRGTEALPRHEEGRVERVGTGAAQ